MPDVIVLNEMTAVLREITVRIFDLAFRPATGLSEASVTIKRAKAGGNFSASTATLTELTGSATSPGEYALRFPAGEVDTEGDLRFEISSGSSTITTVAGYVPVSRNVWDLARSGHRASGSFGETLPDAAAAAVGGLSTISAIGQGPGGQLKPNSVVDNYVYSAQNRPTSWRVRVFATKTACDAAVAGHSDNTDSEVERYNMTATYDGSNRLTSYKVDKSL